MTSSHGPIDERLLSVMNKTGRLLDHAFNGDDKPKQWAFVLLVAPFGEEGRCSYISNGERSTIITLMKEMIARFEGQPEVSGRA